MMTRKILASTPLAACLVTAALSGTVFTTAAEAAPMGHPSVSMAFASASVQAGASPVLTYLATDTPRGSVLYLERSSAGHAWQPVARLSAANGTVRAPADPAGRFSYRLLVTDGRHVVATSAPEPLTVTAKPGGGPSGGGASGGGASGGGASGGGGGGCGACAFAKEALPWLTPIITPIVSYVVQAIAPSVWAWLAGLFAL